MTRATHVQVRLSEEEKAELRARAESHGLSISEYLRRVGLGQQNVAAPAESQESPKDVEAELERLTKRNKFGRGMTTPVARREARRELGL